MWARAVTGRMSAGVAWTDFEARSDADMRDFSRGEYSVNAGVTLPLTGGDPAFLPGISEAELAIDLGRTAGGCASACASRFHWVVELRKSF